MRQEVDHVTFFDHMAFVDYVTVIIEFLIESTRKLMEFIFFVLKLRNEDVTKSEYIIIWYLFLFLKLFANKFYHTLITTSGNWKCH